MTKCTDCAVMWDRLEAAETRMMATEIRLRLVVAVLRDVAKVSAEAARVLHEVEDGRRDQAATT